MYVWNWKKQNGICIEEVNGSEYLFSNANQTLVHKQQILKADGHENLTL